jgi:hypothetical protein
MSEELSNFISRKLVIGVAFGIGVWGALKFFGVLAPSQFAPEADVALDYSMVRPEAERGDFDLSGRSVQRIHLNPKSKEGKSPSSEAALKAGQIAAQKTATQTKKETDKKKAAAAKAAQQKRGMKVDVVDTSRDPRLSASARNSDLGSDPRFQRQASLYFTEALTPPPEEPKEEEEVVLTAEQWKQKLSSTPSVSLALEFVQAYRLRKLTSADFYAVSLELLQSSSPQLSALGRYVLDVETSASTFGAVATQLPEADEDYAVKLKAILDSYAQKERLSHLSQVLLGSDEVVMGEAFRVLEVAINLAQPNAQAGPGQQLIPATSLMIFIPALTSLQANPDQAYASLAQAVLQRIQSILQA